MCLGDSSYGFYFVAAWCSQSEADILLNGSVEEEVLPPDIPEAPQPSISINSR